jgi:hypothetical protein
LRVRRDLLSNLRRSVIDFLPHTAAGLADGLLSGISRLLPGLARLLARAALPANSS